MAYCLPGFKLKIMICLFLFEYEQTHPSETTVQVTGSSHLENRITMPSVR